MQGRMKALAVSGTLAVGLVLGLGAPGQARQTIQPSMQAMEAAGFAEANGVAVVRVNHDFADLSWQESSDPRVEGYNVYSGTDPKNMSLKKVGDVTSYTVKKLEQGKTWYFGVSSYGRIGKTKTESPVSNLTTKFIPLATTKKH